jgi:alpha-tubulin suppressor-like RCC1 family protein
MAIRTDGTLWGWGDGSNGKTGHGNTTSYCSPVQVGSLTDWKTISCANTQGLATKTDGTLWSWGRNQYGQLGDGTTTERQSPVQIGSETDWLGARMGASWGVAWRGTAA